MKKFVVKNVTAVGIGAALFFLLGMISIPLPVENTYLSLQYAVEAVFATLFGPIVGLLIGFIGHTFVDLLSNMDASVPWWSIPWWSWIIASACVGLVIGLVTIKMDVKEGIDAKKIIRFNVAQAIAHLLAWGIIAPCLDILIYGESVDRLFAQGLVAGIVNIITTGIVGTLLLISYAKIVMTKDSQDREN